MAAARPRISVPALRRFVVDFRKGVLDGSPSVDMCAAVSWPLQSLLWISFGIEAAYVEGRVAGHEHCWLRLPDGTIVDGTADQFLRPDGTAMPSVYIGSRPKWYTPSRGRCAQ